MFDITMPISQDHPFRKAFKELVADLTPFDDDHFGVPYKYVHWGEV